MNHTRRVRTAGIAGLVLVLGASLTTADAPDERIEISADGRSIARIDTDGTGGQVLRGAGDVPYGDEPDWVNDIRRQVGAAHLADMNGNGLLDLVVGVYHSNSFPPYDDWHNLIYFNEGGALEASPSWISTDEVSTGDLQVGDINADGHIDVFAANGGFAMASSVIYWGGQDGPSQSPGWTSAEPNLAWNNFALLLDVNGSGYLDIVTANQGNNPDDPYRPMYMFRNTDGTPETVPGWQSSESSIQNRIAAADYNGDGNTDIAISKWVNFETAIYQADGQSLATTPAWTTGETGSDKGIAWGDVTGNGWPDLAVGRDVTTVYANDGGEFSVYWEADDDLYHGHQQIMLEDVTGNGFPDLIEVHFAGGDVRVYLNDGGVLSSEPDWIFDSPGVGTAVEVGDITGNGLPDLVIGNAGDPSLFVFYHQGDAVECPADLTGDGTVGGADLGTLLSEWGPCPDPDDCPADLTGDGTVGGADLGTLLSEWGEC